MSAPIRLTDAQLAVVMAAAEVLAPADRSAFLEEVARRLQGVAVGAGILHRTIAELQRRYWHPPDLSRNAGSSKWR